MGRGNAFDAWLFSALILAIGDACGTAPIAVKAGRVLEGRFQGLTAEEAAKSAVQLATRACGGPDWIVHAATAPLEPAGAGSFRWRLRLPEGGRWACQAGAEILGTLVESRKPLPAGPIGARVLMAGRKNSGPEWVPLADLGLAFTEPPARIRIATIGGKPFYRDSIYYVGLREYLTGQFQGADGVAQIVLQPIEGNLKWIMHSGFSSGEDWSGFGTFGREGMDNEVEFYCFAALMRHWVDPDLMGKDKGIPPEVWQRMTKEVVLAVSEPARMMRVDPPGPKVKLEIIVTKIDERPATAPGEAYLNQRTPGQRPTDLEACYISKVEGMVTGGAIGESDRLWLLAWRKDQKGWENLGEARRLDKNHYAFQMLHLGDPGDTIQAFVAMSRRKPADFERDPSRIDFSSSRLKIRLTDLCDMGGR